MSYHGNGLLALWDEYLSVGDEERLLRGAMSESDPHFACQALLWLALGARKWGLVTTLEGHNTTLPPEDPASGGWITEALQNFGDAPDLIEWLLKHGAQTDRRGANDWTPLHLASSMGYLAATRTLLDHGASVDAITSIDGGWTPLMVACASGHAAIVELLLVHGADVTLWNSYEGGTARDIAAKHQHLEIAAFLDTWMSERAKVSRWKRRKGNRKADRRKPRR
jgi:hypothetical protein